MKLVDKPNILDFFELGEMVSVRAVSNWDKAPGVLLMLQKQPTTTIFLSSKGTWEIYQKKAQ